MLIQSVLNPMIRLVNGGKKIVTKKSYGTVISRRNQVKVPKSAYY